MNKVHIVSLPFLIGIYPVIFLYSHNVKEMSFSHILTPLVLTLLFSAVIFGIVKFLLKNTIKSSLATSILLFIFLNYGLIHSVISLKHRFLMPSLFFIAFYLAYFIYCSKNEDFLKRFSKIISSIMFLLILLNLGQALPYEFRKPKDVKAVSQTSAIKKEKTPDVYLIVLDEYASLNTIKSFYNYNNDQFAKNLENLGFYVARNSKTRTAKSEASMSTTLNMQFVYAEAGDLTSDKIEKKYSSEKEIYSLMTNNKVKEYLRSKGYKHIYIGNWAELTRWKVDADIYYNYYKNRDVKVLDDFSSVLLNTTIFEPFNYLLDINYDSSNHVRNSVLFGFEKLKETSKIEGPKFVFAHILSPHAPFVFGKNGEEIDSLDNLNWSDKSFYLNQYIFVTKQVEQVVSDIIKNSVTQPIIIIQSDHGPRASETAFKLINKDFKIPSGEMAKIFNAYYLPNLDKEKNLYDNISPVNSFRVVFNNYFNEHYKLLDDEFEVRRD